MENLSGGDCDCDCCDCDCDCDGGKTKSTPSRGFRLRLEFDNKDGAYPVASHLTDDYYDCLIYLHGSITRMWSITITICVETVILLAHLGPRTACHLIQPPYRYRKYSLL